MGSTEPDRTARRAVAWLPAAILAVVTIGATGVVFRSDGPPTRAPMADERGDVAVFSVRRSLDPLLRRSADARLVARLDDFVAGQPDDTCLTVRSASVSYSHRSDDPQSPASLQKLLVAVAALVELGGDFRYETIVAAPTVAGGVVSGPLYLRGGGDPVLATSAYVARERNQPQIFSDIDRLADAVVGAGITRVEGPVVGDDGRYDAERYSPVWPSRFVAQGQIGPLSALSVNDGFAYFPEETGVFGAAPDPAAYAARVLTDALRTRGVTVIDEPVSGLMPEGLDTIATLESPPMAEVVRQMLQESDNNTAELVLKELGFRRGGAGTFATGQEAVASILTEEGLDLDGALVVDGSGLAIEDQVSCDLVADLLDHEATADVVESSLPVAGESGTLSRRWLGTDLAGQVRAKTGTLNQVTGLAGHADSAVEGESLRFVLLVNLPPEDFVSGEIVDGQQRLAEILTAHPDLPDVTALRPNADQAG